MKTSIINIIENQTWYRQLVYGGILGAFFLILTWLSDTHPFLAIAAVSIIAVAKEHYVEHLEGRFNWRNFFLLILPVLLFHIIIKW